MRLLVSAQPGEMRAAWVEDGRLVDLTVQRDDHQSRLGNIYLARVVSVDRGLNAAFVDLGEARAGFLPLSEAPGGKPVEGAAIIVRVLRDGTAEKGPRLTARLIDPPSDLEALAQNAKPPSRLVRGSDPLNWLLTAGRAPEDILVDHEETYSALRARLSKVRPELTKGLKLDHGPEPLFTRPFLAEGDIETAIDALLEPCVRLPSGGHVWIEPTHGMVAIDVDSARHQGGDPETLARRVNLEAAAEIPRQLRLRSLSGLIVIDFLELTEKAERRRAVEMLRAGLKGDREPGRVQAMAASGLVSMTRRRGAPALHEILSEPCGEGGSGWRKTPATLAFEALRALRKAAARSPAVGLTLRARPAVLGALQGPGGGALGELESRSGRSVRLVPAELEEGAEYEIVTGASVP